MITIGEVDNYLAHHGVKGMRWGVRKEESSSGSTSDTPAKPKKINAAKAERFDMHANQAQKQIDLIKANPSKWKHVQRQRDENVRVLEAFRDQKRKDAQSIRDGKLTDGQKKAIKGAVVTAALVAAYGTYKAVDSGATNRLGIKVKSLVSGQTHSWSKNDKLRGDLGLDKLMSDVIPGINPGFGKLGTKMNCRRCTFAYEMRRRGYDVRATRSSGATGQSVLGVLKATDPSSKSGSGKINLLKTYYKEGEGGPLHAAIDGGIWGKNRIGDDAMKLMSGSDKADKIFKSLSTQPNGARGELGVGWKMGGGHSMAWEIVRGKPVIVDAQSGKTYKSIEDFKKFAEVITDAGFTRLDNLPLNDDFLLRWVSNNGG